MATRTFHLDGTRIRDIASFYAELNRVFMDGADWQLGESLDALNDLLYGSIGVMPWTEAEHVRVVWEHHDVARAALGVEATREYYRGKLARPDLFSAAVFQERLTTLETHGRPTYFDLVLEVFADHPEIDLQLR